jgi:purine-nucleoside phosphorylase
LNKFISTSHFILLLNSQFIVLLLNKIKATIMWELVQETVNYIKNKTNFNPEYGVILGSGLGSFTEDITVEYTLPYNEIPNFPVSTVQGHKGALVFGTIGDKKVMAMQGRFHFYEGYDMKQVTFPVRVMKYLGVTKLIVSNASGGVNSNYEVGSVVIIKDHVNMFPEHPLRGKNDERFGPRFLNMNEAYNKAMINKAKAIAVENNITVHDGVYLGLQGPTFETFAEYKMVKVLGADCVGMSTVPEVIVARHMGIDCFGLSVITDMGDVETAMEEVSHEEVLKAAAKAEPHVRKLIKELIIQF